MRQVKVAEALCAHPVQRIAPIDQQEGLQRAVAQDIDPVEGVSLLKGCALARCQVNDDPGRCIPRQGRHAGKAQGLVGRLEAVRAFPMANVGAVVADGRIGACRGEGEHQTPAALNAVSKAQEAAAETVTEGAALHMGAAYVEDTDIATAGDEQGVQLPAKALEIGRFSLQHVFIRADEGITRQTAALQREQRQ